MTEFDSALWIGNQVIGAILHFWQISVVLLILLFFSLMWDFIIKKKRLKTQSIQVIYPVFIILAIWITGTVLAQKDFYIFIPYLLLLVQFFYCSYLIYKMKETRLFSLSVILWHIWFSLLFAFVAVMSIADDWM